MSSQSSDQPSASYSAFDIIGPPMVGPSSSHTAGACRLGLLAKGMLGEPPVVGRIGLHGSLAATGIGHATDRAVVAGVLGWAPDDERLKGSLQAAQDLGVQIDLGMVDLGEEVHPNSVWIELQGENNSVVMEGSSVGGGSVVVTKIDGYPTEVRGQLETLILWHSDTTGFLAGVVSVCACVGLNIATVRTSRRQRGDVALTIMEFDGLLASDLLSVLKRGHGVRRLAHLAVLPGF
ncbi:L-serine ammonia-lyase, iron-sulfur-dependent, subunit beta [bacterium]|nr:MAG: L-serine ammonia-lyase, iron-sulfur-dependent, subunit beta [bacterium]